MAFYSSKCVDCTESTKQIVKTLKLRDEKGFYTVQLFECKNYICEVCSRCCKSEQKLRFANIPAQRYTTMKRD